MKKVRAEGEMLGFMVPSDFHKFLWLSMRTWQWILALLILSWNGNTQSCDGQSVRTICPEEGQVEALRHTCPRAVMSSVWIRGFWDAMLVWSESSDGVQWFLAWFCCCRWNSLGEVKSGVWSSLRNRDRRLIKSFTFTAEEKLSSKWCYVCGIFFKSYDLF